MERQSVSSDRDCDADQDQDQDPLAASIIVGDSEISFDDEP